MAERNIPFTSWESLFAHAALQEEPLEESALFEKEESKHTCTPRQKLTEGTSNFWTMRGLPLLIFDDYDYIYDRVYDMTKEEIEDEDSEEWEKKFEENWDKYFDYCALDESEQDELKADIKKFNDDCRYNDDIDTYEYDVPEVEIKPGYYEAAQLYCNTMYLSEDSLEKVSKFFKEMKEKYHLTELGVSYQFSNGETGYHKVTENYHKH